MAMEKTKKRQKTTVGRVIVFTFLVCWCLIYGLMLLWVMMSAFKGRVQYVTDKVGLPDPWKPSNFVKAFTTLAATGKSIPTMIFNSLWRILGSIFLSQFCANAVGYCLGMYKFKGRDAIYWTVIITSMIPLYGTMGSALKLYSALGMYDTPLYILASIGIGGMLIPYACYRGLSWQYGEAAMIDGAGHFTVYFKIMLPQMIPIITAQSISGFIGAWNDYMTPLIYLPSFPSLATGLYIYEVECRRTMNYPTLFCGLIMSSIPSVLMFAFCQKTLMSINIGGALKG